MLLRRSLLLAFLSACCAAPLRAQSPAPAYLSDAKFQEAMTKGHTLERHKEFDDAVGAYKKANKIAGGQCISCLDAQIHAETSMGRYKDAAADATAMRALATLPKDKALSSFYLGRALLYQSGEKPKAAQLEAAHAAFQDALSVMPKLAAVHYLDGQTLAKLGKLDEARAEFTTCVSCTPPNDPSRLRAQHFAENPLLSTKKMAPAFTVKALDGTAFSLDEMGGKVVLIDFWATWCGPCNEELPHLKQIAQKFRGEPLVILSVSWDADEDKWKSFIAKNEMTWPQYRDADHKLTNQFGIQSIPHYFTIDSDGILTAEMMGSGSDVEGKLKKLLARARQAQTASGSVAGN